MKKPLKYVHPVYSNSENAVATLPCITLRAIMTSYQQSESPILVDARPCIGQGNFPNEGLAWSQTVKMQIAVHGL